MSLLFLKDRVMYILVLFFFRCRFSLAAVAAHQEFCLDDGLLSATAALCTARSTWKLWGMRGEVEWSGVKWSGDEKV